MSEIIVPSLLRRFFSEHPKAAAAFSGGADSAYLLYAAKACCCDITAYYVRSQFQPAFEKRDAERLCAQLGVSLKIIELDVLSSKEVAENPHNRCYFCKRLIFGSIAKAAAGDGYTLVLDGTNASDDASDRPGMKALKELSVLSPLRLCGITKDMVRQYSKAAGLFTWDKPAYACLATRIPAGQKITLSDLRRVEDGESALSRLGFSDFRIRLLPGGGAKIQLKEQQMPLAIQKRREVLSVLGEQFTEIMLDLRAR